MLNTLKREKCVVMAVRGQKRKVWVSWTRPERGKRVKLVGERSKRENVQLWDTVKKGKECSVGCAWSKREGKCALTGSA